MSRFFAVACAFGLWAVPASAQETKPEPPTLTARQQPCTPEQRALCNGTGQRALQSDHACDACGGAVALPMPAEVVASPPAGDSTTLQCSVSDMPLGPSLPGCTPPPILDTLPRP